MAHTAQMVELFGSSKANVSEYIANIFQQGELLESATVRKFRTVRKEGNRTAARNLDFYIREAQHAQSKPDFLAKMTIASKEANETTYWLNLLHDNGYLDDRQFSSLDNDMQRILYKLIAIVKTTKENLEKKK